MTIRRCSVKHAPTAPVGIIRIDREWPGYSRVDVAKRKAHDDAYRIYRVLSDTLPAVTFDALVKLMKQTEVTT